MDLYGSFTIREWLMLSSTEDVHEIFRKSLRSNDEPMAVCALDDLIRRGDTDLVMSAINESFDAGRISPGSHFATALINALSLHEDSSPELKFMIKMIKGRVASEADKERFRREIEEFARSMDDDSSFMVSEETQFITPHSDR